MRSVVRVPSEMDDAQKHGEIGRKACCYALAAAFSFDAGSDEEVVAGHEEPHGGAMGAGPQEIAESSQPQAVPGERKQALDSPSHEAPPERSISISPMTLASSEDASPSLSNGVSSSSCSCCCEDSGW